MGVGGLFGLGDFKVFGREIGCSQAALMADGLGVQGKVGDFGGWWRGFEVGDEREFCGIFFSFGEDCRDFSVSSSSFLFSFKATLFVGM